MRRILSDQLIFFLSEATHVTICYEQRCCLVCVTYQHLATLNFISIGQDSLRCETGLGLIGPLKKYRRPASIRRISNPPVFGRDLYATLSKAKTVVNNRS